MEENELLKYLKALVYLQAVQLSGEGHAMKSEVLLARAGLPSREIANILGKTEHAVAKAVSRARSSTQRKEKP